MERRSFYSKIALSILIVLISGLVIQSSAIRPVAALLIGAAAVLYRSAETNSLKTGRTDRMKALLAFTERGGEIFLVSSLLTALETSTLLTVSVLGAVALQQSLNNLTDREPFFGEQIRIGLLIALTGGSIFNEYVAFYGALALSGVAAYDVSYNLYHALRED